MLFLFYCGSLNISQALDQTFFETPEMNPYCQMGLVLVTECDWKTIAPAWETSDDWTRESQMKLVGIKWLEKNKALLKK